MMQVCAGIKMMPIRTCLIVLSLLINNQCASAAPRADVILMDLHPTEDIDINAMREHKYKDVLKGVINNAIDKLMHAEVFPVYIPLGETVNLCGDDAEAVPLNDYDVLK